MNGYNYRFTDVELRRLEEQFDQAVANVVRSFNLPYDMENAIKREILTPQGFEALVYGSIDRYNQLDIRKLNTDIAYYVERIAEELSGAHTSRFATPSRFSGGGGGRSVFSSGGGNFPAQAQSKLTGVSRLGGGGGSIAESNAYALKHADRAQKRYEREQVQEVRKSDACDPVPGVIVLKDNPNVDKIRSEMNEKTLITDDLLELVMKGTISVPNQDIVNYSEVQINSPMINVCQIIKLLKSAYTDLVSAPSWVINVRYPTLVCDNVVDPLGKYISTSFNKAAEKASAVVHLDGFISNFLVGLSSQINDNKYVYHVLLKEFNKYLEYYFREPGVVTDILSLESWGDISDLFKKESQVLRPWVEENPQIDQYVWALLKSSINAVFPNGKSPIIDPTAKENRGIIASHPNIQIKKGKYLLRDYGNMNAETWKKFESELVNSYVIRKVMRRVTITNIPKNNILPEADKIVIPTAALCSAVHWLAWTTTRTFMDNKEHYEHIPLTLLVGYDENEQKISWSKQQGMMVSGEIIYF